MGFLHWNPNIRGCLYVEQTLVLGHQTLLVFSKFVFLINVIRYNYPYHKIEPDIWRYYMLELSFYWSLSISQWFDVKRKDFWEMFIHHNTTIALLMFSWTAHFTRIGSLILLVHDCADHLLELAKMCRSVFTFHHHP